MTVSMAEKASVTENGAVLLGKNVACDAFDETRPIRIVTHAHADHMAGLPQSLRKCRKVLMTEATKDLINAMRGPFYLAAGQLEALDYGQTITFGDERITLYKADHMLGAAQVMVEDSEEKRIVFTGDFRIDQTPVLESDVLVIEATYGSPHCKRRFHKDIQTQLISLVEKALRHGPVCIFGYHGKLQEVMEILHRANVNVPFITPENVFEISKVCEKHGMRLGKLMLSTEREAAELLEKNTPCITFSHMHSKGKVGLDNFRICVSGWEFYSAIRQVDEKEYLVALSDHSDFDGLLEYVRVSKPQLVITDNSRVHYGETLAKEIYRHLGIEAVALPKNSIVF
jgi:putative mRNA 3-end processing factor